MWGARIGKIKMMRNMSSNWTDFFPWVNLRDQNGQIMITLIKRIKIVESYFLQNILGGSEWVFQSKKEEINAVFDRAQEFSCNDLMFEF